MPISLHDFSKNFVVKSNALPAFGRRCSPLGFTRENRKIGENCTEIAFKIFPRFQSLG